MAHLHQLLQEHKLIEFEAIKKFLQAEPYSLTVKEKADLYILSYDMIGSDLKDPVVQECRGIILEKHTNKICCHALDKFFNAGETGKAAAIDESSARYLEKLDGSIIKLFHHNGQWLWASNNMINLFDVTFREHNFGAFLTEVITHCSKQDSVEKAFHSYAALNPSVCFFFELIHPENRIVVQYKEKRLVFLGARNVDTHQEYDEREWKNLNLPDFIQLPRDFTSEFKSVQQCVEFAKNLSVDQEGFVVVDKNFNRVKVKGEAYVRMHHFGSKVIKTEEILESILKGEQSEILAYQPYLTEKFTQLEHSLDKTVNDIWIEFQAQKTVTRAELAKHIKATNRSNYMGLFMLLFIGLPDTANMTCIETKLYLTQKATTRMWLTAVSPW
jgi:hypothetical protein